MCHQEESLDWLRVTALPHAQPLLKRSLPHSGARTVEVCREIPNRVANPSLRGLGWPLRFR